MTNKEVCYTAYQAAQEEVKRAEERLATLRLECRQAIDHLLQQPGSDQAKRETLSVVVDAYLPWIAEVENIIASGNTRADEAWKAYVAAPREPITERTAEHTENECVLRLPRAELALFLAVLREAEDVLGSRRSDEMAFAKIVPDLRDRQAMLRQYHAWNGDPEVWEDDLKAGGTRAKCEVWRTGCALFYLSQRLEQAGQP